MTHSTYQPEERARQYRLLTDEAIKQALESRWEDAASTNQQLLEMFPRDLSTLNRLGKANSELGNYDEARKAYTEALEVDPENNIARKNLGRLSQLGGSGAVNGRPAERIDPRLFIEETGKTGFAHLIELAPKVALARLSAGEQVYLQRERTLLYVANAAAERIGRIEPRLASRLIKFMDGGNQYAAGIMEVSDKAIRLIIRETFQDPSQFGKVSFPAQGTSGEMIRPYTKDTMVRTGQEDDEEDEYDEDGEEAEETREPELEEEGFAVSEE